MPHPECDACLAARRERGLRILDRERERLLAEHMLAGGSGRLDLLPVPRMRRRQHDGADRFVGEHILVRRADAEIHLAREVAHRLGLERHATGEMHQLAVALRTHQLLAPPAKPDHRDVQHRSSFSSDLPCHRARERASLL